MGNIPLAEFVGLHWDEITRRCRANVATRSTTSSAAAQASHGVPLFLGQVIDALRLPVGSNPQIGLTAGSHGHDLLLQGFTVEQVVKDYGDVCLSISDLAAEMDATISPEDFGILNGCVDDAIASALTRYVAERNQVTLEGEFARGARRLEFLAHELGNQTQTAMLALDALRKDVKVTGSAAAVLRSSLTGIRGLVDRALAEARLSNRAPNRERFLVSQFIQDLAPAATLEASARGVKLTVAAVQEGVEIRADRQVLTGVVGNLLHNAFKFTQPFTAVALRVGASAQRVLIEVEDTCGGLPAGSINELFRPYVQRSADRTGSGLGLAVSRQGVEENDGQIYARNLPHHQGCVFTVDLPRAAAR